MAPPCLLVPPQEGVLVGVEKQHPMDDPARVEIVEDAAERLEEVARTHVGDDRRAPHLRALVHEQVDEAADHLGRQVVDAEVAVVLEDVHRRRLARAGEPRDDDEVLEALRRRGGRPVGDDHIANCGGVGGRSRYVAAAPSPACLARPSPNDVLGMIGLPASSQSVPVRRLPAKLRDLIPPPPGTLSTSQRLRRDLGYLAVSTGLCAAVWVGLWMLKPTLLVGTSEGLQSLFQVISAAMVAIVVLFLAIPSSSSRNTPR